MQPGPGVAHGLRVAFAAVPALTLAGLALLLTAGMLAAGLAFRAAEPRAWNAVGVFAVGGVICGYGLLLELLGLDGATAAAGGSLIAALALGYLWARAR